MIIENKECPDAEGQYNKSSLSRELSVTVKLQSYNCSINMGLLAARSGTDSTWSPQLSNLAEWDWVPISLQNKYGGEWHRRTISFCSVLSFPTSKHQEKVFNNFFKEMFGHQEAWWMKSSWVTSLIVIWHLVPWLQRSVLKIPNMK